VGVAASWGEFGAASNVDGLARPFIEIVGEASAGAFA
jgi:hypothetical protein